MDVTWTVGLETFEWDEEKARLNLQRHGVSFPEAVEVFFDPLVRYLEPEEVEGEQREGLVRESMSLRLLLVVHTERGERHRVISARVATAHERQWYEQR